jgi:cytidylate kinase
VAIITISRGSLSGGRTVAECLAERLGVPALADEILQGAAAKIGASEEAVRGGLETPPGLWARMVREQERYVLAVQTALAEACLEGNLVYHGLAGQFLLRGLPGVLKVRLIAPLEMRVRALLAKNRGMTPDAAAEFIANVDQERKRRARLLYDADVEDPAFYDLTVNLRSLSLDAACAAIAEAAAQPEFRATAEFAARHKAFAEGCRRRLDACLVAP